MAVYESKLIGGNNLFTTGTDNLEDILNKGYNRYVVAKSSNRHPDVVWYTAAGLLSVGDWRFVNKEDDITHTYPRKVGNMMRLWFDNQQWPIVGVRINSNGMAAPFYFGVDTGIRHWVVLTGISQEFDYDDSQPMAYTQSGTIEPLLFWKWRWVRVFNPFDNQTEYYPFQYFLDTWIDDGNGSTLVSIRNDFWYPNLRCWSINRSQ